MVDVTATIPSKDRKEKLENTINNLLGQEDVDLEIIVVDDNSNEPYKFDDERITVIRNDSNYRDPYSRNRAMSRAEGDYILMLDDDNILRGNDWLSKAIEKLKDEDADLLYPKKLDYVDETVEDVSIFKMRWFDGAPRPINSKEGEVRFGPQVYLFRSEIIEDVGGYNTILGKKKGYAWTGSADFQARIAEAGYKLYYWPELVIEHHIGTENTSPEKSYWVAHNQVIFNIKNLKFGWLKALGYLFYDSMLANLIYRNPKRFTMMVKGSIVGMKDTLKPGNFSVRDGFKDQLKK